MRLPTPPSQPAWHRLSTDFRSVAHINKVYAVSVQLCVVSLIRVDMVISGCGIPVLLLLLLLLVRMIMIALVLTKWVTVNELDADSGAHTLFKSRALHSSNHRIRLVSRVLSKRRVLIASNALTITTSSSSPSSSARIRVVYSIVGQYFYSRSPASSRTFYTATVSQGRSS